MSASPLLPPGVAGAHNLTGLTGATADGGTWQISHGMLQVTRRP
jgi:hypothetical protein